MRKYRCITCEWYKADNIESAYRVGSLCQNPDAEDYKMPCPEEWSCPNYKPDKWQGATLLAEYQDRH